MPLDTSKFGQRVRQYRLARGWEVEYLADLVGCSPYELWEMERHKAVTAPPELIERVAAQLEADVDELFVLAGRLPPCLAWVQSDPSVAKLLGNLVSLIDSRVTLPYRPGGLAENA